MSAAAETRVPLHFIVGMPRAATTWLCKCLNEHSDVVAFGESTFWGRRYVEPGPDDRYDDASLEVVLDRVRAGGCLKSVLGDGPGCLKHIDQDNWASIVDERRGDLSQRPTPADVFRWLCDVVALAESKSICIEKTPHHLNSLGRIDRAIPASRFIIMVREPYGFMLSYKHQGDRKPEEIRRRFHRRYHPLLAALVWKSCMRRAVQAQQRFGDRVMLVKYEDIQRDAVHVLTEVQSFLGVEAEALSDRVPRDNTSFPGERRPELRGEDCFWLHRIAGSTMRLAGYERVAGPAEPARVLWSVIRLPWWVVWNMLNLRRFLSGSVFGYIWNWLRPSKGVA